MAESSFTFRVEGDLKAKFTEAAKAHDRSAAQLLRDFMREYVMHEQDRAEHDAWFRSKVREALADSRPGITHDAVIDETRAVIGEIAAAKTRA